MTRGFGKARAARLAAGLAALAALAFAAEGRAADNQLYHDPATSTPSDSVFTVDVVRNAGDSVQGFDVEIRFDHTIVRIDDITPGGWLTAPGYPYALYNTSVAGEDTIRFSAVFLGNGRASAQAGTVAVLHFVARDVGVSPLDFVSLRARDTDNHEVPFSHSLGDRIIIDHAVATAGPTLGRLKAQFR